MELKKWGHRVRLATHAVYRSFVEGFDLEFYPLGGDPTVLSEYVVRNRGECHPDTAQESCRPDMVIYLTVPQTMAVCT